MPRAEETQGIQFHTLCLRQSPHRGAGFIGALLACSLVSCTALLTVLPLCSANKMLCFAVSAHLVLAGCSCAAFCSCSLSKANSKAGRESKSWSWACLRCWVRSMVPMPWVVSEWALLVSWSWEMRSFSFHGSNEKIGAMHARICLPFDPFGRHIPPSFLCLAVGQIFSLFPVLFIRSLFTYGVYTRREWPWNILFIFVVFMLTGAT